MRIEEYAREHAQNERAAADAFARWDGRSVRDLDTEPFYDSPHLERHPALQRTVPEMTRQQLWNSAEQRFSVRSSVTLLAVDDLGEALVKGYVVNDDLNADGQIYRVMSIERALALIHEYGASLDLKTDPNHDLGFTEGLRNGSIPVSLKSPEFGATYRGTFVMIHGDLAYQMVGGVTAIAHRASALAITDPQQYVGKIVDISYPCGQVGLVRQVETIAHEAWSFEKPAAEKNVGEREL